MAIVAVAIVPASAALPLFIYSIHQERAREVRDMALRTSQIAALEIERIVRGTEAVLQTMALAPAVRSFGEPGCNGYIADVTERLPQIRGFAVADAQGQVRCVTGLSFGADGAAGESWFEPAFRQENLVVGGYTKRVGRSGLPAGGTADRGAGRAFGRDRRGDRSRLVGCATA